MNERTFRITKPSEHRGKIYRVYEIKPRTLRQSEFFVLGDFPTLEEARAFINNRGTTEEMI